ncbi:MAG TPA: type II secretion system protein [bacterium]|jgi:type IV pilus assembly protein PilA|nr:type II secretion system protein [bacterium]
MAKKQNGFTLVELMIVVAIIGILAAVAIPKFAQMLEKSREGATKGNIGALKSAVSNYYADQQGNYPQTDLDTSTWYSGPVGSQSSYPGFVPQYMDVVPAVKVTAQNTVNTVYQTGGPGVGSSAAAVTTGVWSNPAFATDSTGFGWKYDNTSGELWVNSALLDMSSNSYTIYGYQ